MNREKNGIVSQVIGALLSVTTTMFGVVPAQVQQRPRQNDDDRAIMFVPEDVRMIISGNADSFRNKRTGD